MNYIDKLEVVASQIRRDFKPFSEESRLCRDALFVFGDLAPDLLAVVKAANACVAGQKQTTALAKALGALQAKVEGLDPHRLTGFFLRMFE